MFKFAQKTLCGELSAMFAVSFSRSVSNIFIQLPTQLFSEGLVVLFLYLKTKNLWLTFFTHLTIDGTIVLFGLLQLIK